MEWPLCSDFPEHSPGPALGLSLDFPLHTMFVNAHHLREMNMSAHQALGRALENLDEGTPPLRSASIMCYKPVRAHTGSLPAYINRLHGTNILVVFFPDRRNSIRMLVPRVIDAMAAALSISVSHLCVVACYERQVENFGPMFATACDNTSAIYDMVQGHKRHVPNSMNEQGTEPVSAKLFVMQKLPATGSNLGYTSEPRVFPGLGQQHALHLQSHASSNRDGSKGIIYMPWPVTAAQRAALEEQVPMAVQDLSSHSPWIFPPPSCHACYKCTQAVTASSGKCGKCQVARYCGASCQRSHWSTHKHFCKPSNSQAI